jgi:putative ABC transport system permease protein
MRARLVVSEIAFAIVLLIGAGLMVRGFQNLARMDQGFDPNNVLTFNPSLPESKYPETHQVSNFYKETLRRLCTVPGIQSAAVVSELPALGDSRNSPVTVEGQPTASADRPLLAEVRVTSEDYFRAMAMPVRRGRAFAPQDSADSLPVAVISESAARRFWPRRDPLGLRLRLASPNFSTPWLTVVGIVGDVRHFVLDSEVRPTIYVPYLQQPIRSLNLVLRTEAHLDPAVADIRTAVHDVDSTLPVYGIERLSRFFADLAGGVGVVAALMTVFAAIALVLAAAGIYAVMAYSVAQRIQEFGIRLALGAQRVDISKLVLVNSVRLVGIGLALGLPAALSLGRVMSSLLSGLVAVDPLNCVGFTLLLSASALLASYIPARRATKVDPIIALRHE